LPASKTRLQFLQPPVDVGENPVVPVVQDGFDVVLKRGEEAGPFTECLAINLMGSLHVECIALMERVKEQA
jgi:hypothetical protein